MVLRSDPDINCGLRVLWERVGGRLSSVAAIRGSHYLLGVLVTIWKGLGAVYENSVDVLFRWKQKKLLPLHVRKFLRSTQPVRVQIGSYFYADRSMVLTLLDIINKNTFNKLLVA